MELILALPVDLQAYTRELILTDPVLLLQLGLFDKYIAIFGERDIWIAKGLGKTVHGVQGSALKMSRCGFTCTDRDGTCTLNWVDTVAYLESILQDFSDQWVPNLRFWADLWCTGMLVSRGHVNEALVQLFRNA